MHKTVPNQLISGRMALDVTRKGLLSKFDQVCEGYHGLPRAGFVSRFTEWPPKSKP